MSYLLDADWVIQALAGQARAFGTLQRLSAARIAISWLTVGEIYEGAFRSPNPQAHLASFRQFLLPFRKVGLDDALVERFAETRAYLRRQGQLIPDFDILLGATALRHNLTVLTFNTRHLGRIPGLRVYGLRR